MTSPQEVTDIVGKLQAQKKRSVLLFVERQGDPPLRRAPADQVAFRDLSWERATPVALLGPNK